MNNEFKTIKQMQNQNIFSNLKYPTGIYIYIYMNFGGYGGDIHGPLYNFCLLFKNTVKVQQHDLYLNQILDHYDF